MNRLGIVIIAVIIVVIVLVILSWGSIIGSTNRLWENKKQEFANTLDKRSLQSEPEAGVRAIVCEDGAIYDDNRGIAKKTVTKGEKVFVISLDKSPRQKNAGTTFIMKANDHGDFINGTTGWIDSMKLDFRIRDPKETIQKPEPVADQPVAPAQPTSINLTVDVNVRRGKATVTETVTPPDPEAPAPPRPEKVSEAVMDEGCWHMICLNQAGYKEWERDMNLTHSGRNIALVSTIVGDGYRLDSDSFNGTAYSGIVTMPGVGTGNFILTPAGTTANVKVISDINHTLTLVKVS